jgi:N-acetylmuramoyl-L-alanine amidase
VLVDPGHGGKDPGCIGLAGTFEKHVALEVGLALRRQLLATGRYRVAMTRDDDVFISLRGRVERARNAGASLLVSLHANASPDRAAHGTCVYRFAWRPSDAHAALMARWENRADGAADPALHGASRQVLHILAMLMRRETQVHSAQLQRAMVHGLRQNAVMLPVPDRHARFAVLSAPDIAGVLIEMGFLSNRREEALLTRRSHQVMLAASMRHAVDAYFAGLPQRAHHG